jgi:hypothetical protein
VNYCLTLHFSGLTYRLSFGQVGMQRAPLPTFSFANKRQENCCRESFMRLLVLLRPNNKQIRLWRKNNGKNPN